jgi:creatinine amidohydrolase
MDGMQWEALTAADFQQAVQDTGVCVVPLGVLEKHSEHLPLGTDCYIAHRIACLAADKEPAVVYPSLFFGQIYEARCFPGTITIHPRLLLELLSDVLDNIGRNGFKKIVLYNGHGGNNHLIGFLAQCSLWEQKPYELYVPTRRLSPEGQKEWDDRADAQDSGHAGEYETALMLGLFPDLVKMDRVPEQPARPLGRFGEMSDAYNAIWWYADYPDHYAGDARRASQENGRKLVELSVDYLAQYIARVKADDIIPTLAHEFSERANQIAK